MRQEQAETLALQALGFLASDEDRLQRFMDMTGMTPDVLQARASESDTLVSVLDALLADETVLLMFAADRGFKPEDVARARVTLGGTYDTSI
ncbi:MAG: DUF3572 domain-containing protein [Pseudomonadota bacterium]